MDNDTREVVERRLPRKAIDCDKLKAHKAKARLINLFSRAISCTLQCVLCDLFGKAQIFGVEVARLVEHFDWIRMTACAWR